MTDEDRIEAAAAEPEMPAGADTASGVTRSPRAFTLKSLVFGISLLLFTIYFTAINDLFLRQTSFVANHLPPGPIFLVVALALIWNPIWKSRIVLWSCGAALFTLCAFYTTYTLDHSFWFSWHWLVPLFFGLAGIPNFRQAYADKLILSGRELIVSLIIIFAGCWTAGASLNYHFTPTHIGAWTIYSNNVQMHNVETIEYVPQHLFPSGGLTAIGDDDKEKQRVYDSFRTGSAEQGFEGVPWDAWLPSIMSSWGPLFIFLSTCTIALALLVHRQWAHHEQLAYPIAEIGTTLFTKDPKRILPNIFYNNLFWIAAIGVITFHGIRYLHVWFPNNVPNIHTHTYFNFLLDIFPTLRKSGVFQVHNFNFYFTIVGICYFLSREIGLTLGIAPFLLATLSAQLYLSTGTRISGDDTANMRAGAYIAYALIILYTGRTYYWNIIKKTFNFKPTTEYDRDGVFAARILFVSFTGLVLVLAYSFELGLMLALLFSLTGLLLFLIMTRIVCETGLPYVQAFWEPGFLLVKCLGVNAISAGPLVILYYVSAVLFSDPKEAVMPYVANGLKMAENHKLKLKRILIGILIISMVAVFLSIFSRLYQQYTMGGYALHYPWADQNVPSQILNNSTVGLVQLENVGMRNAPGEEPSRGFFERLSLIDPDSSTLAFLMVGAAGVALFFFLRFRFTGFPLHPVLFLIWGIHPNFRTFYSFLIGWAIRELIIVFGGGKVHEACKPFFLGLIVAELFMGIVGVSVGTIYCLFTGFDERPPQFIFSLG